MAIFTRVTLLGLFASIGVGLAVCIGLSTHVAPGSTAAETSKVNLAGDDFAGDRIRQPTESPEQKASAERTTPPRRAEADSALDFGPLPPVAPLPPAPVIVAPYPAKTAQVAADQTDQRLLKVIEYLTDRLAPQSVEASPAPVGEAIAEDAGQLPAPDTMVLKTKPRSETITRAVPAEGDDELSINIQDADIREVLEALGEQGNLNILASNSVQGKVSATLNGVSVESALDAILKSTGYIARREGRFIYVGTPQDFESLEQSLDTVGTRVYRPNYVTAAELQALITPLLTPQIGVVSVSSPAESGIGSDATNVGGDNFAGGEVVLVRDYAAVLAQVDQVVAEIDRRPMQVAIEAMILSVRLDDGNDFGVDFELLRNEPNVRLGWGTPLGTLASLGPLGGFNFDGGLKFGFLDSGLGAFLNALETVGDTNVIATPRLMVLNKHQAEILIGEELGYVSTTITETSTSQSVEFLEVGAQLRLRPFISSDGLIRMEVHPELSSGSVVTENGFTLPNKETTQVTTNIMVRDGCTVIIGGLMREELETTTSQIPFFGSLPVVGVAFRTKHERIERREIIVLITPHIVYEPETCEEGQHAAGEFHRRQATYAEKMSPLNKRAIARRYFRLAQNAWAAGNRRAAMRFAEMAVYFDPLNRATIDLRSDIWLGEQYGDHTLEGPPPPGAVTAPLDGTVIAPWLLDELEREPVLAPTPLHPLDPGIPGPHKDIERPRSLP